VRAISTSRGSREARARKRRDFIPRDSRSGRRDNLDDCVIEAARVAQEELFISGQKRDLSSVKHGVDEQESLSLSLSLSHSFSFSTRIAHADLTGVCPVSSANQLSRIACEASATEEGERRGRGEKRGGSRAARDVR